jgi:hypothetical protein
MPEWTPAKIAVAALASVTVFLIAVSFFPRLSIREFEAYSIAISTFEFSDVKLSAYKGLKVSRRTENRWSGRGYSEDRGVLITGQLTNIGENDISLLTGSKASPVPEDFLESFSSMDSSNWPELDMQFIGATYIKNWNQVHGYFIAAGQTVEFQLVSARFEIEQTEIFDLLAAWDLVDIETLDRRTVTPIFNFERSGTSLAWGDSDIRWKIPHAVYWSDLRVP